MKITFFDNYTVVSRPILEEPSEYPDVPYICKN